MRSESPAGRLMDVFDLLPPSSHWLFGRRTSIPQPRGSKIYVWTAREDALLARYYPNYFLLQIALPHRTHNARKIRAFALGLTKKRNRWTDAEKSWLLHNYEISPWKKILENIPNHSRQGILTKARELGLSHHNSLEYSSKRKFDNNILEQIRRKADELRFTLQELDEEVGIPGYFTRFRPSSQIRIDAIEKALAAMGGELVIRWRGDEA